MMFVLVDCYNKAPINIYFEAILNIITGERH